MCVCVYVCAQLYDYPKFGTPFKQGSRYYYYYNSGLQAQYVLYSQAELGAEGVVLLDPNTLSDDGTIALKVRILIHTIQYNCM